MPRFCTYNWLKVLSVWVLVCISHTVLAVDERYAAAPMQGNQIRKDSSSTVIDTVYANHSLKPFQTSFTVRNLITFKLNEFANVKLPGIFSVSVSFKVYYTRNTGDTTAVLDSTDVITLGFNYDSSDNYGYKAIYTFLGGHRAQVKITNVSVTHTTLANIENSLMLENEILVNREYDFSCTGNAVQTINKEDSTVTTKGELIVHWAPERAADEYDLEWAYIDQEALTNYKLASDTTKYDPRKVFGQNATRVSLKQTEYLVPVLYDNNGILFYRVRPVQVKRSGQRLEANWSSDYTNGLGQYAFSGHENLLNWQATTSFAEDGKRKSVVQYYDGSLRGRQTVTKDNTTDTTIVAESFYDYQGRPVIQVLPTPSLSRLIKYTPNFNSVNSGEYEKDLYDGLLADSCYCTVGAPAMDSANGAAKYYSASNPNVNNGIHQYIPKAGGFPFAETRYTPDNTGRIALQSGVGPDFQIGKIDPDGHTHETKYYYSGADQEELDALFGTEVGKASHYFKNMVRDANGQYSVSYVDMHGRTIATALAGKPFAKLDTLASNKTVTVTKRLLGSVNNFVKDLSIMSNKSLMVTSAGDHIFSYSLQPDSIRIKACDSVDVCYDCLYDLEITITDDCNNSTLPNGQPIVISASNLHYSIVCDTLSFPQVKDTIYLREGSYQVSKKLTISQQGMEYFRDSIFIPRNTCKNLDSFIAEQKALLPVGNCVPVCDSCITAIGSWTGFQAQYMNDYGIAPADSANYREQALRSYKERQDYCAELCDGVKPMHKSIREQMLADVSPPSGQYARDSIDEYSIFRQIQAGSDIRAYQQGNVYLDANGKLDSVNVGGAWKLPENLSAELFRAYFKPIWAEALLPDHPEYCKLQEYEKLAISHSWDERFERVATFKAAVDSGFLNPGNFSNEPSGAIFNFSVTHQDPLFTALKDSGIVSLFYKDMMEDSLAERTQLTGGTAISMWALATIMAHCPVGDTSCMRAFAHDSTAFKLDSACSGELDIAWQYYRGMYLQEKREVIAAWLTNKCPGARPSTDHFVHFADFSQMPEGTPTDEQGAQDFMQAFIDSNCYAYANQWWNELRPCNFHDSIKTTIINRLVQVCREGGDINHMFGASTVKPSSANTDRSFEQVIKEYAAANYNSTCNVYLITAPRPWEQQPAYADKPVIQKPDSCECTTLGNLYKQYEAYGQADSSFSAYLYRTTQTSMADSTLTLLLAACNGDVDCSMLKEVIFLPPALQCGTGNVCVSCVVIDTLFKNFKQTFPGILPAYEDTDSLQRSINNLFERFMNSKLGFGMRTHQYLDFMDSCDIAVDTVIHQLPTDTAAITSAQLQQLVQLYYDQYINPANRVAELDMRTFAGNKTPAEGPKGVFDVNGQLVGNTTGGTTSQINTSFATLWNSSSVNRAVGTLTALDNGRFRLLLQPGQQVPCNGIVGMRYYRFDVTTDDTLHRFGASIGSFIDFGDTTYLKVEYSMADSKHTVVRSASGTLFYENQPWMEADMIRPTRFAIAHYYTHTATPVQRTVTVYHTDTIGQVQFDDPGSSYLTTPTLSNLRGYFPQQLAVMIFAGTRDSTLNRTDSIYNWSQINSIELVELLQSNSAWGSAPFMHNNFGSFENNHNLRRLWLAPRWQEVGDTTKLGKTLPALFPNLPVNFPNLHQVFIYQWNPRYRQITDLNFALPNLKTLQFNFQDIDSDQIDTILNQVARAAVPDSGYMFYSSGGIGTAESRTSASDAAVDALTAKNWDLRPFNSVRFSHTGSFYSMNDQLLMSSGFCDFLNHHFGTAMGYYAVQAFYLQKTGATINACLPPVQGPQLCGKATPAFPRIAFKQYNSCDDSTLFAVAKGTQLYGYYRDSLQSVFEDRYKAKCLDARYKESFTVEQRVNEYHYTLYYYDQAGNLVKTVPPAGVNTGKFGWMASWSDSVKLARSNKQSLTPAHTLPTNYRYNTLNQVVAQHSPDGGKSEFWYDRLGRLAISRNAKQYHAGSSDDDNRLYNYTKYDALGRITEVGQVKNTNTNGAITDNIARSESSLNSWLLALNNRREQVTTTIYDIPYDGYIGFVGDTRLIIRQRNLRNRVSYVTYADAGGSNFNQATMYTYDIHGNVDTLLQDYGLSAVLPNIMNKNGNRFKKITYKYDLVSGKVNMVMYQRGWSDQFFHRYSYDAENRLTQVETSTDSLIWERDARYEYYRHGPLARTTIGEQSVQGIDYAYTLQGWLKGINSTGATSTHDMGGDGKSGHLNQYTGQDAIGVTLNYFTGEYKAINAGVNPFPGYSGTLGSSNYRPLYNGNISSMSTYLRPFENNGGDTTLSPIYLYNYKYDQLNRLTAMDVFKGFDTGANSWNAYGLHVNKLRERISYDANGNIKTYRRNGTNWQPQMDSLTYNYYAGTNRLKGVDELMTDVGRYGGQYDPIKDIDPQPVAQNYEYDSIGNLIKDSAEKIRSIEWTVYGKIKEINRHATAQDRVSKISYSYDAMGNRIGSVTERILPYKKEYRWYVRDGQGNVMAVYRTDTFNFATPDSFYLTLGEQHIYGSSRLGYTGSLTQVDDSANSGPSNMQFYNKQIFYRGLRQYELSNHLGNVLSVVSDKKIGVYSGGIGSLISYYKPDILTAQDYYPFGMVSRLSGGLGYRYGFNGKENDADVKGYGNQQDYGMRIYDPRLGRFLSVDPLTAEYPWNSTYAFAENDVIRSVDLDGAEKDVWTLRYSKAKFSGQTVLSVTDNVNRGDYLGNKPTTIMERIAIGFVGSNNLPANGTFKFIQFAPEFGISDYAKYEYTDIGGKQHVRYFDAEYLDFMYEQYGIAEQRFNKKMAVAGATFNLLGTGLLWKTELKGAVGELKATTSSTQSTLNGKWVPESTAGWSKATIEYQEHVTGVKAGSAYKVGDVKFDGVRGGTLLEAKGAYDNFIDAKTGQFKDWFLKSKTGAPALLDQAQRQITAANGAPIEWNFSSQRTLNATKSYLESQGVTGGINYKLNPKP